MWRNFRRSTCRVAQFWIWQACRCDLQVCASDARFALKERPSKRQLPGIIPCVVSICVFQRRTGCVAERPWAESGMPYPAAGQRRKEARTDAGIHGGCVWAFTHCWVNKSIPPHCGWHTQCGGICYSSDWIMIRKLDWKLSIRFLYEQKNWTCHRMAAGANT